MINSLKEVSKLDLPLAVSAEISIYKDVEALKDLEIDNRFELMDDRAKLVILLQGSLTFMLDFNDVILSGPALLFISPEQACKVTSMESNIQIYSVSYSPALVVAQLEKLTVDTFSDDLIFKNNAKLFNQIETITSLMHSIGNNNESVFISQSLHGLLLAMLSLIAGVSSSHALQTVVNVNPLVTDFRRLLKQNFKVWKRPVDYANALGTSVANLNQCVRLATGSSLTEQIHYQIILEIKRLLFFSELNMKEIGYEIGFDDPVYFNRLFKKLTRMTPLNFRTVFRDRYHKYLHPFYQCTQKTTSL